MISERHKVVAEAITELLVQMDEKNSDLGGHGERVGIYALLIAQKMRLANDLEIYLSALLHDIGKVRILDDILNGTGSLNGVEIEEMRKHVGYGVQILEEIIQRERIPELQFLIPGIKHHHENWDGSGYPDGLTGDAIPMVSLIIRAADTLDAMTRDRSYHKGLETMKAFDEIHDSSGTLFHPEVVEAIARLYVEGILDNVIHDRKVAGLARSINRMLDAERKDFSFQEEITATFSLPITVSSSPVSKDKSESYMLPLTFSMEDIMLERDIREDKNGQDVISRMTKEQRALFALMAKLFKNVPVNHWPDEVIITNNVYRTNKRPVRISFDGKRLYILDEVLKTLKGFEGTTDKAVLKHYSHGLIIVFTYILYRLLGFYESESIKAVRARTYFYPDRFRSARLVSERPGFFGIHMAKFLEHLMDKYQSGMMTQSYFNGIKNGGQYHTYILDDLRQKKIIDINGGEANLTNSEKDVLLILPSLLPEITGIEKLIVVEAKSMKDFARKVKNAVMIGAPTYEVGLFPPVTEVLEMASLKRIVNKKAAMFGSYSWSGGALKRIREIVEPLKWSLEDVYEFIGGQSSDKMEKAFDFGANFAKKVKS